MSSTPTTTLRIIRRSSSGMLSSAASTSCPNVSSSTSTITHDHLQICRQARVHIHRVDLSLDIVGGEAYHRTYVRHDRRHSRGLGADSTRRLGEPSAPR